MFEDIFEFIKSIEMPDKTDMNKLIKQLLTTVLFFVILLIFIII